jgi:hypothetical protein
MSSPWTFLFLIPHIGFAKPIEHNPFAIVPHDDPRLVALAKTSIAIDRLLNRFTDQFGENIQPSALVMAPDYSKKVDYYAVASFRNCIAICGIVDAWVRNLTGGNAGYPSWSDYFDFYPFTTNSDGDLAAKSVASTELNRPDDFRGQKTPYLPALSARAAGVDNEILDRLWGRWDRVFWKDKQDRSTRALFRSLEVAYQAMRVPAAGSRYPTIHEFGVGIALWVSAIEILAHPRQGNANLGEVLNLLDKATWSGKEASAKRYRVRYRGVVRKVPYVSKLYDELYRARNDYLHGNPVTVRSLFAAGKPSGPTLLHIAPLIYRAALDGYLPRARAVPGQSREDMLLGGITFLSGRIAYEDALLSCRNV